MAMLIDLLSNRFSVRSYQNKPIPAPILQEMLEAGNRVSEISVHEQIREGVEKHTDGRAVQKCSEARRTKTEE